MKSYVLSSAQKTSAASLRLLHQLASHELLPVEGLPVPRMLSACLPVRFGLHTDPEGGYNCCGKLLDTSLT